ncbi:hypothetical protein PR001_g26036 [Phytophthora rubi]|uniref:HTH CENPB-type domain-containing protein n=1 Tax=Phytophthora rubi TaxID=129364 RepID=A0A6A3I1P7_9STRA|nr:hypothetical protein PR001_g26036 [Phytophthora rubi]
MTQSELVAWARKKFKLRAKPSRNAISDIMKNAESIMSATYGDDSQHKPTPPPLEMRLAAWNIDMERRNICLSRELITKSAPRQEKSGKLRIVSNRIAALRIHSSETQDYDSRRKRGSGMMLALRFQEAHRSSDLQKVRKERLPADHCLFVCRGCGELHDMGKCPMDEFYNQNRQWFDPAKHCQKWWRRC